MTNGYLHSIMLEMSVKKPAAIPATMGHQTHALFLDLIRQVAPELATRLHDASNYRPFTVSALGGVPPRGEKIILSQGQPCHLRLTFLDDGQLWNCLNLLFLKVSEITLRLDKAEFSLNRILSTANSDTSGWAGFTDWLTLANTPACRQIKFHFASPTAFNLGDKNFGLFPEPVLLWDSFLRVWNNYAPQALAFEKVAREELRSFIQQNVIISDYNLSTTTLHYPRHLQKGFWGKCAYTIQKDDQWAAQLTALAEFARYAGAGCKTTMGMGQVRAEIAESSKTLSSNSHFLREAGL